MAYFDCTKILFHLVWTHHHQFYRFIFLLSFANMKKFSFFLYHYHTFIQLAHTLTNLLRCNKIPHTQTLCVQKTIIINNLWRNKKKNWKTKKRSMCCCQKKNTKTSSRVSRCNPNILFIITFIRPTTN